MAQTLPRHRFTVDEYEKMVEIGILTENDRVELLHGEIVVMAPIGSRHAACVRGLNWIFSPLGDRVVVAIQDPVKLANSMPEPDVGLHAPHPDLYAAGHPTPDDVLLLVEVSDTTQVVDREVKGPLYAENGIREYWIVDLQANRVEAYGDPDPAGGVYRDTQFFGPGETLSPLAFADLAVRVDDVLP